MDRRSHSKRQKHGTVQRYGTGTGTKPRDWYKVQTLGASTRDMARNVFNFPSYVKPYVVGVANKLLGADNRVFLNDRAHLDYRKSLNGLFMRRALQSYLPSHEEV